MQDLHGILTNDSLMLAAMDEYGIVCLASRDDDFDHVLGIRKVPAETKRRQRVEILWLP